MGVNEAGTERKAFSVNNFSRRIRMEAPTGGFNPFSFNQHIADASRRSRAVNYKRIFYQK